MSYIMQETPTPMSELESREIPKSYRGPKVVDDVTVRYYAAAHVSAGAQGDQLSAAGSQGVPQADGGRKPDGHPGDAAVAQPRTARETGPADRAAWPGKGAAQPGVYAFGRGEAARGDCAVAGDRAEVP